MTWRPIMRESEAKARQAREIQKEIDAILTETQKQIDAIAAEREVRIEPLATQRDALIAEADDLEMGARSIRNAEEREALASAQKEARRAAQRAAKAKA